MQPKKNKQNSNIHNSGGWSIEAEEVGPPLFLRGKRKINIFLIKSNWLK